MKDMANTGMKSPYASFMRSPSIALAGVVFRRPVAARGLAAAAGLLLAGVVAACSSSGAPSAGAAPTRSKAPAAAASTPVASPTRSGTGTSAGGTAIPGLITFNGTFVLSGAVTQHSAFTAFPGVTSPASSCARLAAKGTPVPAGDRRGFQIPAPPAGSQVYFIAEVTPYHGPGTYSKASILAAGASFIVGNAAYNPLAASATATVTFRANGSGIVTFRDAAATKPATGAISGSISWTCSG